MLTQKLEREHRDDPAHHLSITAAIYKASHKLHFIRSSFLQIKDFIFYIIDV